jgi:hypothetical protein
MKCHRCDSERIAECSAYCSDCFHVEIGDKEHSGYVPDNLGFGGGNNFHIKVCLNCGQVQGQFPKPVTELEFQ